MAEKCRATSWRTAFCHPPEKRFLRGAAHSGVFAVRRLAFFAAFWSAVNRGLRPRKLMYFLTAKSTKNSPADAFAYFVPSNVRNGRLFAGLQANRPRFLPLLAGTSFHSFGIGPESFAAFRGGKDASGTNRKHRSLRSPLEAVLNRRILDAFFAKRELFAVFGARNSPHYRLQRRKNNRKPACPEREAGKGVRRRGQTACCLPSRHSLNGACFCAVKSCSCCARSTRAGGCSREKRHADGFGTFNFATLVFLLLARHNPQAVSARAACVG